MVPRHRNTTQPCRTRFAGWLEKEMHAFFLVRVIISPFLITKVQTGGGVRLVLLGRPIRALHEDAKPVIRPASHLSWMGCKNRKNFFQNSKNLPY